MSCINVRILVLSSLFLSYSLKGQKVITPEEAVAISIQNNLQIALSASDKEIAERNKTYGNAGFLPSLLLSANAQQSRSNIDQRFTNGLVVALDGVSATNASAGLGLNWTLFDGTRMFVNWEILKQTVNFQDNRLRVMMDEIAYNTLYAYYFLVSLIQEKTALEVGLEASEMQLRFVQKRFEIGSGSEQELIQIQLDRNNWKSLILNLDIAIKRAENALVLILNRPLGEKIQVISDISLQDDEASFLQNPSALSNSNLSLAKVSTDLAALEKKRIKAARYPTLNFVAAYNLTRTSSDGGFSLFNFSQGPVAGFSLNWNLFNGGILNSQLKVAEIQRQQTLIQEKIAIIEAQAEFLLVNSERAMLKDLLLLEKENFELAQKNLSFALERYKLGSANELTVKEAQRSYEQASNRFQKLKFEAKVAELRLKRVKGDLLPAKGI